MRTNLPVTTVEYPIHDDTLIVSKTDTKGRLKYFNDQFVAASGFTEAELIGQPHNIIRHPDMPTEAFEDLWTTLKMGKPWGRRGQEPPQERGFLLGVCQCHADLGEQAVNGLYVDLLQAEHRPAPRSRACV